MSRAGRRSCHSLAAEHGTGGRFRWQSAHKFMYVYFLAGFLTAKYHLTPQCSIMRVILLPLIVWVGCLLMFDVDTYIYKSGVTIIYPWSTFSFVKQIRVDVVRYIAGFAGSIGIIGLCKYGCSMVKVPQMILYLGKSTKEIYIIQMISFLTIVSKITYNFQWSLIRTLIISIIMTVFCVGLACIINKFKWLRKIIV